MSVKSPIPVVAAVIQKDGRILIAQRPEGKHLALKWEFPGGKVELGEDPQAALHREIREELGSELQDLSPLPRFIHHYPSVSILMIPFLARLSNTSAEPHAHEHIAIKWIDRASLDDCDLAAADWPIVDCLSPG